MHVSDVARALRDSGSIATCMPASVAALPCNSTRPCLDFSLQPHRDQLGTLQVVCLAIGIHPSEQTALDGDKYPVHTFSNTRPAPPPPSGRSV